MSDVIFNLKGLEHLAQKIYERLRANLGQFAIIQLNEVARAKSDGGPMPVDTGRLIGSVKNIHTNTENLIIGVTSDVEYAYVIEFGHPAYSYVHPKTQNVIEIRARPGQFPFKLGTDEAAEKIGDIITQIIEEEVDEALNMI